MTTQQLQQTASRAPSVAQVNSITALVPAKPFAISKRRLRPALTDAERARLSAQLLDHVLEALQAATSVHACWVIGGDAEVAALANRRGARWLPELGGDLNDTLAQALERLPEEVTQVLILPMDLPLLTAQAVDALATRGVETGADAVIAPDRRHRGTNALLLARPFRLRPAFGPDSLARHRQAAQSLGLRVVLHTAPEFAFDLDTPEDLATWRRVGARHSPCVPHSSGPCGGPRALLVGPCSEECLAPTESGPGENKLVHL